MHVFVAQTGAQEERGVFMAANAINRVLKFENQDKLRNKLLQLSSLAY